MIDIIEVGDRQVSYMNLSDKKLLITGIGGFVGLRTAEIALAQGIKVRGLQHSPVKAKKAEKIGAEVIIGSVTNKNIALRASQGVDIVLHAAGLVKETGTLKHFREVNVGGSVNMAQAAKEAGVKTFVHLSSCMVYGFNYSDRITESGPLHGENHPYCQTKIEAEEKLLELNDPPNFGITIIRPGDVYGPGSIPWVVKPILLMRQKLFALADDGKGVMNHLYVDNLLDAIFLAMEKEAYGEAFNITDGEETSWKEYFTLLAEIAGLPAPFSLPKNELQLLLRIRSQGLKLFGKKSILPESLDFVTRPYAYSISKAKKILNYEAKIDLKKGMQLTEEWLQKTDIQKLI